MIIVTVVSMAFCSKSKYKVLLNKSMNELKYSANHPKQNKEANSSWVNVFDIYYNDMLSFLEKSI